MPANARLICKDGDQWKTFVFSFDEHILQWLQESRERKVIGVEFRTPENMAKEAEGKTHA